LTRVVLRHRVIAVALAVVVLAVAAIDVRLFVVPRSDKPAKSDAFVVLGGDTFTIRLKAGLKLAREYPDSTLVVSTPGRTPCPRALVPRSRLICFDPDPSTTQGEAREAARLALVHGWTSMTVVTTADQVWRARLRFSRCWDGDLRVVQAPTSVWIRIREVPYEMGATVKAEVFQRTC
jgi:uncharacterized SAM-binding protein YcdF (DUF218 family)